MQRRPPPLEKRGIHAVAHQGVGEQKARPLGPYEKMLDQPATVIRRVPDQMPYDIGGKPLAEHRSRLQRTPILGLESVHSRKHDALNRSRYFDWVRMYGLAMNRYT